METSLLTPQLPIPEQVKRSRTFDFNLEALRGFAAISVVWHHIIQHRYWLDPHYAPTGIASFNPWGHLSVLVFFVLSGYVIGRVHIEPLERQDIIPYIKKRFLRIYPIYFISLVVAILIARTTYPASTIIGNLAMTQNFFTPVIFENNPIWSLNFEILFYLLFIPLSFFRLNAAFVALLFAALGIFANTQEYYQGAGYSLGFAFWLCGVIIARNTRRPATPSFALMVSSLFLLLSLHQFNFLTFWLIRFGDFLHMPNAFETGPVQIVDLGNLPYCILLVLLFSSQQFPYRKYITALFILLPFLIFYRKLHHVESFQDKSIILPACFYLLALVIYFWRASFESFCQRFIQRLSGTGAWSYGLYMIHFPIIAIFVRIDRFSGTAATFSIRLVCYLFLCFVAAYFLEKKYQPWIKRLLAK